MPRARDGNLGIAQIQHAGVHDLRAGGARRFRNDAAVGGRNSRALPHGKQTAGIGAMRQDGGIDQLDPGIGAVRQGPYPAIAEGLDGYPVTSIRAGPLEELAFSPRPSLSWTVTVLSRNVAAPPWTTTRPRSVRRSGIADDGDIAAGHAVVATRTRIAGPSPPWRMLSPGRSTRWRSGERSFTMTITSLPRLTRGKVTSTAPSSPGMRKGEYLDMKDSWSWRTLARPPLKPARHSEDAAASATAFVLR